MIKSFSKINLSLRVLKKLKTGLHDIQSNTMLLNLYDVIKINKINRKKDVIFFKGKFKKLINKSKNSVSDVIHILRTNGLIKKENKYKIVIDKKIPVFSGLGGGTSNAAFLIKYFTNNKIKSLDLKPFEKKIGSDLRLFFYKQVFQKSLKKYIKYKKNFVFNFVLVYPNIRCSTKNVYSKVKKYNYPAKTDFSKIRSKNRFISLIRRENNDLQKIVTSELITLKRLLNFISIQQGCYFSRMTGSGSVCFGIFKSKKSAILGLKRIKKKFPKYCCVIAKTI